MKCPHPPLTPFYYYRYVDSLKKRGKAEELANVDVIAGLDLLANRGQWAKCLQTAENEGVEVLNKYVALYSAQLLQEGQPMYALNVFAQYGSSPNPANFNLYRYAIPKADIFV